MELYVPDLADLISIFRGLPGAPAPAPPLYESLRTLRISTPGVSTLGADGGMCVDLVQLFRHSCLTVSLHFVVDLYLTSSSYTGLDSESLPPVHMLLGGDLNVDAQGNIITGQQRGRDNKTRFSVRREV